MKFKNRWGGDGYQGINSMWRDLRTGHIFEVQFHTPDSFEAKTATHDLYKVERLPGTDDATADALERQQNERFSRVPRPPGASGITLTDGGQSGG